MMVTNTYDDTDTYDMIQTEEDTPMERDTCTHDMIGMQASGTLPIVCVDPRSRWMGVEAGGGRCLSVCMYLCRNCVHVYGV